MASLAQAARILSDSVLIQHLIPTVAGHSSAASSDRGTDHLYSPRMLVALQQATHTGDYKKFKEYTAMVDDETKPHTLRGVLEFNYDTPKRAFPIEEG